MHEMWKRQQVHEDARNLHMAEVRVIFFFENGESDIWEATIW